MADSTTGFNLIDEEWIPVLGRDGAVRERSLVGVLRDAADAEEIAGDVPSQSFALLRLVLAVLHRSLRLADGGSGPQDLAHWRECRSGWTDVVAGAAGYLEVFRDRFDLFHPATPFFQVHDLAEGKAPSGLEKLIIDVPNGEPFFTTRIGRGLDRITAAESARWLVHVHAFDPSGIRSGDERDPRVKGGKGYPIGPGWTGQIGGVHLVGPTLKDTLLLNLIGWSHQGIDITSGPDDLPPWERAHLGPGEEQRASPDPRGPIELYTWQTRRVRLVGDRDGVTGLVLCQGDRMTPQNRQAIEPLSAWRHSEPQSKKAGRVTYMPREVDPARAFWRGLESVLPDAATDGPSRQPARWQPPEVVRWGRVLHDVLAAEGWSSVQARSVGIRYGSNQSVVEEMVDDRLVLPIDLLDDPDGHLRTMIVDAVGSADEAVKAVAGFATNLAEAEGVGLKEKDGPRDAARESAYTALDHHFRTWLTTLTHAEPAATATRRWQLEARRVLLVLATRLLSDAGPAAWVGRTVGNHHVDAGRAEAWFRHRLHQALPFAINRTDADSQTPTQEPTEDVVPA